MRLRLKALAARDAKTPAPADLAARPAVLAAVAEPAAARDVADLLVNFADDIVRALAAPGTPERAETLATFDAALQRLEADSDALARRPDAGADRPDRPGADRPSARIAKPAPGAQGCRSRCSPMCARRRPAPTARSPTATSARRSSPRRPTCSSRPASAAESDALLKANLAQEPLALLPDVGPGGNAKRRGDKAEALRWYREAYEKSEGPATRLQWGASYLAALVDLAPADEAAIEAHDPAALARGGGPARRLRAAQRPLAAARRQEAAGLGPGRRPRRVDDAAARRARHALRLRRAAASADRAACKSLLTPAAKATRLSRTALRSST